MYDMPVGSHSGAMYQVAFAPDQYAIFILWMGAILEIDTSVLENAPTTEAVSSAFQTVYWNWRQ